jgi:hypothetical protein
VSTGLGGEARRKVVAGIVYLVGVVAALFAAYLNRVEPNAVTGRLVLLWGIGVILVAAAAVLWPHEDLSQRDERGNDADKEGTA